MSVDSISGKLSETEINDLSIQECANDSESNNQTELDNNKETVSITVNIRKVGDSNNSVAEQMAYENSSEMQNNQNSKLQLTSDTIKENEVFSSKVMLNGNFFEKLEEVKNIITEILEHTLEKDVVDNGKVITIGQEYSSIPSGISHNQKDKNPNGRRGISNKKSDFSKEDMKQFVSKTSFNEIDENQASTYIYMYMLIRENFLLDGYLFHCSILFKTNLEIIFQIWYLTILGT